VNAIVTPLREDDIAALCVLAQTVWRAHYPPIIGEAQTEYMLAQRYRPADIRAELRASDVWWDVIKEDATLVAFASSFREGPRAIKLDKLYVHPARQRKGYGGALIACVCERARRTGAECVTLAVNKRNVTAIAAYRSHGFEITEAVVKDIGAGFVMDDYVMSKSVGDEGNAAQRDASSARPGARKTRP
jgi:ribosomal protein S18 acetylase RimI-like enzyme